MSRIALALAMTVPLLAQQGVSSASLRGFIDDANSAPLPGIEVSLRNLDRGQVLRATTDASGEYRFLTVPPGQHQIEIRDPRFLPLTRQLSISVGQGLDVPLQLRVAGDTTFITVSADAPVLETARAEVTG